MSVERSFEAWEEVQRHGQDLADKLAQGFTGLIQSHITAPQFPWPNAQTPKLFELEFPAQGFVTSDFGLAVDSSAINGVSAIFDIGNRIGQAGVDFGACINGMVQQFFRRLPVPFRHDEIVGVSLRSEANMQRNDVLVWERTWDHWLSALGIMVTLRTIWIRIIQHMRKMLAQMQRHQDSSEDRR